MRIRRLHPQPVSAPQEAEGRVPAEVASVQPPLMPLGKASQDDHVHVLGYTERDYLELVDWAGRAISCIVLGYKNPASCWTAHSSGKKENAGIAAPEKNEAVLGGGMMEP